MFIGMTMSSGMGDLNCQNSEIFVLILLLLCYNTSAQIAVATAPSYAPIKTNCPLNQPLLRLAGSASQSNQTLSNGETDFVNGRSRVVSPLWRDFYRPWILERHQVQLRVYYSLPLINPV
uniref:Secreted protein n=1 Tax=Phakopsora pachyrhizi TaxID=170000 RepID=A0A0S1MK58_PHAPC